jgi:hypothetical protein
LALIGGIGEDPFALGTFVLFGYDAELVQNAPGVPLRDHPGNSAAKRQKG